MKNSSLLFLLALIAIIGSFFFLREDPEKAEAALTVNSPTPNNNSITDGLVGHWTFDGPDVDWGATGAEIIDRGSGGNDGAVDDHITQSTVTSGAIGQGMYLDGVAWHNNIELPVCDDLTLGTGDKTLALWVNFPVGVPTNIAYWLSDNGSSYTNEGYYFGYQYFDDLEFHVCTSASGCTNYDGGGASIKGTGWHHVAAVIDRDAGVTFYLDGVSVGTQGTSVYNGTDIQSSGSCGIISNGGAVTQSIDDVRVYNRTLSAEEVAILYNIGK